MSAALNCTGGGLAWPGIDNLCGKKIASRRYSRWRTAAAIVVLLFIAPVICKREGKAFASHQLLTTEAGEDEKSTKRTSEEEAIATQTPSIFKTSNSSKLNTSNDNSYDVSLNGSLAKSVKVATETIGNLTQIYNRSSLVNVRNISIDKSKTESSDKKETIKDDVKQNGLKKTKDDIGVMLRNFEKNGVEVNGAVIDDGNILVLLGDAVEYEELNDTEKTKTPDLGLNETKIRSRNETVNGVSRTSNDTRDIFINKNDTKTKYEKGGSKQIDGKIKARKDHGHKKMVGAKDGDHFDVDYQADMTFERVPRIELFKNEILTDLKVKQILECNIPRNATMTSWYKDGEKVDLSPSWNTRLYLGRAGQAVINGVQKEDDGLWTCRGVDPDGKWINAEPIKLIILEKPSSPILEVNGVRYSDPGSVVEVKEYSTIRGECRVAGGRPRSSLTWLLTRKSQAAEEKDLQRDLEIQEESTPLETVSTVKLYVEMLHHNTTLSCLITHPALPAALNSSVRIDVLYSPRFAISRVPGFGYPLLPGSKVSLLCEVMSRPASKPVWYRGLEPWGETINGMLVLENLTRQHSDWYKCATNNSLGFFSSIGYYLNVRDEEEEVTEKPDKLEEQKEGFVEIPLGGAVQLQCPIGSIGCWGRWSSSEGRWAGAGSSAPHGALSMSGLLYQQAGRYRCEGLAHNTRGQIHVLREATIVVKGAPTVFPLRSTVLVSEGELAVLSAEYCANPAASRVLWISSDRLIKLGEQYGQIVAHNATNSSYPDCRIAELTIDSVGLQHGGEYSLLVRNSNGSREAVFQLAVTATRQVSKSISVINEWLGGAAPTTHRGNNVFALGVIIILLFYV